MVPELWGSYTVLSASKNFFMSFLSAKDWISSAFFSARSLAHKTSFSKDVVRRVDQLLTLNIWVKFSVDDIEILFFFLIVFRKQVLI